MKLPQLLNSTRRRWKQECKAGRKLRQPLCVEALEERAVPTVLFMPQFGPETVSQDLHKRINSPKVEIVLWGNSWVNNPNTSAVIGAISGVIHSSYLQGLQQYGVTTNASIDLIVSDNVPDPSPTFTQKTLTNEIQRLINANKLPNPAQTPNMIVDMVTAPGITASDQPAGTLGYNSAILGGNNNPVYGFIWNGTSWPNKNVGDACSLIFSHELAECMTDPGSQGYEINPGAKYNPGTGQGNQIGDLEGNVYEYRLEGTLVQPYWSANYGGILNEWLISDQWTQMVLVKPLWNYNANGTNQSFKGTYDITINAGLNDNVVVGGVTQNGQSVVELIDGGGLFTFDTSTVDQVTINAGSGTTRVYIGSDTPAIKVLVNGNPSTTVVVAGGLTRNLANVTVNDVHAINVGDGRADQVQGPVTIQSPHVTTALTLDDHLDPTGGRQTIVDKSQILRGTGLPIAFDAGRLSSLTVMDGSTGNDFLTLGDLNNPLDQLPAKMTIAGGKGIENVIVDGRSSAAAIYSVNNQSLQASYSVFRNFRLSIVVTNQISFSGVGSLTVSGRAAAPNAFYVTGPHTGMNISLVGGSSADTFNLGNATSSLDNLANKIILNGISGDDTVNINDSYRTPFVHESVSFTVTPNEVARHSITFAGLRFFSSDLPIYYGNVAQVNIIGSSQSTSFLVQGTAAGTPVSIQGGAGFNVFQVGDATHSLDLLQADVTLSGGGVLTLDDEATTALRNEVLANGLLTRSTSDGSVNFGAVHFQGIANVTYDNASGVGSPVFIESVPAGTSLVVNGHAGSQNEFVISTATASVLGNLTIQGQVADNDFALFEDDQVGAPETYTFSTDPAATTTEVLQRSGLAPIRFAGLSEFVLYASEAGGNAINVQSVAPGLLVNISASNGDSVVIGSLAPATGGSLATIQGPVIVGMETPDANVSLTVDDSADTVGQNATITPPPDNDPTDPFTSLTGLGSSAIDWNLGAGSQVTVLGGSGGNSFLVLGLPTGPAVAIDGGSGSDSFQVGDATHALDLLQTNLTLNSGGTLTLDDEAGTAAFNEDFDTGVFTRVPAGAAQAVATVDFQDIATVILNTSTAGDSVAVNGLAASTALIVNSQGLPGTSTDVGVDLSSGNVLGTVTFHGQSANNDIGEVSDFYNPAAQTYTIQTDPANAAAEQVSRSGVNPITFDGVNAVIVTTPQVGGSAVNVLSTAAGMGLVLGLNNNDSAVVGSLAPGIGGTLVGINGSVLIGAQAPNANVSLTVDDSADTVGEAVTIDPPPANDPQNTITTVTGLANGAIEWSLPAGCPVTLMGGSGGNSFVIHGSIPNVALTIEAGNGNNLLIAGQTVVNFIGGTGNDILIGGSTNYDFDPNAIAAIMAELAPATNQTFYSIATDLFNGANGLPALNANTVQSNGLANQLTGGGGIDWFFASSVDQALDFARGDLFTTI